MVQFIQEYRKPSFSERLGNSIVGGSQAASEVIPQQLRAQELERGEIEAGERMGLNLRGMTPEVRQKSFEQEIKSRAEQKKSVQDQFVENKSYDKIKEAFGEKFADIWKAAPTGGKTELLKHAIDAKLRGDNVDRLLEGVEAPQQKMGQDETAKVPQMKKGQVAKDFEWPDFTQRPPGYAPKDWIAERKTWRKENSPVFLENKTKLQNSKRDSVAINKLNKLNKSKKLPEGFARSIINPSTGEIYGVAQLAGTATPETQEWVKEIARFQNRAKDAFGSRVTNFDLQSYMKQFPNLLNTTEGRERIIKMMKANNEMDQLYETALEKVYQKYGLNGIPQEEADKLAQGMIKDDTDRLTNEYLSLDEKNQEEDSNELSGRKVDVIGPDGQLYEIDEREIDQLPQGFRIQ